ncbi:MAG: hypothetical protein KC422_24220, partial [Trueperaceae bacterium]|nr:hypothetical protein [Trueperaceae bacterium]
PELSVFKAELMKRASDPEHFIAIAKVVEAENEAAKGEKGDKNKVLAALKAVGKWGVDTATDIGKGVAEAYIKASMGLP